MSVHDNAEIVIHHDNSFDGLFGPTQVWATLPSDAEDDGSLASLAGEISPSRAGRADLRAVVWFGAR
jgi:hypothetical protein